jgi:hypothetical protein
MLKAQPLVSQDNILTMELVLHVQLEQLLVLLQMYFNHAKLDLSQLVFKIIQLDAQVVHLFQEIKV